MSDRTVAYELAELAAAIRDAPPAALVADVTGRITDVVGNALAACALTAEDEPHRALERLVRERGGRGEAGLFTGGALVPASAAALVNGTLAHSLDFDDTHLPSVLHPSAAVVPAALATGQARAASGASVVAAAAMGIEVCNRLGLAGYSRELRNSIFFEKGFHATSICGTIGAAVAAAMVMDLDVDGIVSAMGIAASMGAGVIEANRTGGTVKRIHAGWAAHAGLEAAAFAAAGVTGPPTVFEGRFGLLRAYLDTDADVGALTRGLGEDWELLRTVYKPYPANHFTHPAIDCALELRAQGLDPDRVVDIELGVAAAPLRTIGEPREEKIRPRSPYHAKFSGPYAVATALVGGGGLGVYLDDYTDEAFADPRRRQLAEKVRVVPDPICDDEFPQAFSAVLRIRDEAGQLWEHRRHSSKGSPEHPMTPGELEQKFRLNAAQAVPEPDVERALSWVRELPAAPVVTPLPL